MDIGHKICNEETLVCTYKKFNKYITKNAYTDKHVHKMCQNKSTLKKLETFTLKSLILIGIGIIIVVAILIYFRKRKFMRFTEEESTVKTEESKVEAP